MKGKCNWNMIEGIMYLSLGAADGMALKCGKITAVTVMIFLTRDHSG